jgi:hypothetical protein
VSVKVRGKMPLAAARHSKPRLGRAWGRRRRAKETLGFAWYTEKQWQRLRELADDVGALDATYADWLETAERAMADLRSNGVMAVKVPVDVDEAAAWCTQHSQPFNSAGRAAFVAELLRTQR